MNLGRETKQKGRDNTFPVVLVLKNLPASAGDVRDAGWTPGLVRSPG